MTKDIMDLVQAHWEKNDWVVFNECRQTLNLPVLTFEEYLAHKIQQAEQAATDTMPVDEEEIWNYIPQFKNNNSK